jgi:hypothetical protein
MRQRTPEWANYLLWFQAEINWKVGTLMGEVQDAVDAVVVELGKAKDEIVSKIADLEAQIAAGEVPNLDALKAAAQALDDVVPDAPVEPPVEPPVV